MTERDMDQNYVEAEERFRESAGALWGRAQTLKEGVRANVDLSQEEREQRYMAGYQGLNETFEELANKHAFAVEQDRQSLERTLYAGTGAKFSEHLTAAAAVPDERLPELMRAARRSNQTDLERAVAITALERDPLGSVFKEWAERNPERANALQRLQRLPDSERVRTRTLAMRPPKAAPDSLAPTQADLEKAADDKAAAEASRRSFFGKPFGARRFVGRRVS